MSNCALPSCCSVADDGTRVRTLALRTFCEDCERRIARVLRDLPEHYAALHAELAPARTAGEKVSGSHAAPIPLRLDVATLIDDLEGILTDWENALRQALGWRGKQDPAGPRGIRFQATCRWLGAALIPLLAGPGGGDAGLEILHLGWRCRRALGTTRLVHYLPAPCPSCDHLALTRANGASSVRCEACGRGWSETEYSRLVIVVASEQRRKAAKTR